MKLRNKKTGETGKPRIEYQEIYVDTENHMTHCYKTLRGMFEEWEDYEEPKEYWYIAELCAGLQKKQDTDNGEDRFNKQIGNYFETKEEAEKAVRKLKAWKRLKDKNFHFLKYSALGFGEIEFSLDFEDMDDEGEIGELQHDLDLLFGGEE